MPEGKDAKGGKAKAPEVKGKDKQKEVVPESPFDLEIYRTAMKSGGRKERENTRSHENVFYVLKFKSIVIFLLYQMNKLKEALEVIGLFQKDCQHMKEENLRLYSEGVRWRIEVKLGEKELSLDLPTLFSHTNNEEVYYGQLLGDIGELEF